MTIWEATDHRRNVCVRSDGTLLVPRAHWFVWRRRFDAVGVCGFFACRGWN